MASIKNIVKTPENAKNMIGFLNFDDIMNYYAKDVRISNTGGETAERWILTCK